VSAFNQLCPKSVASRFVGDAENPADCGTADTAVRRKDFARRRGYRSRILMTFAGSWRGMLKS
jgi:hypothetical protein